MITPLEAKLQRQFINKFSETSRLQIKKYYIEQTKINVNAYKESFELEVESLIIREILIFHEFSCLSPRIRGQIPSENRTKNNFYPMEIPAGE